MSRLPRVKQPLALNEHNAAHLSELFGVFGDTSRVRIVSVLVHGETPVSVIVNEVGLTKSAVSHHLRVLRQLHMVQVRRDGRQLFYSLDEHVARVFQLGLEHMQQL
jgi:ArsR family transcriptional regulator